MAWMPVKRTDTFESSDKPYISFTKDRIIFNTAFSRAAELGPGKRVSLQIDEKNFKIGFEFSDDTQKRDSWPLLGERKSLSGKHVGMFFSARGFLAQCAWARNVARLPSRKDKRFVPKREAGIWVVQLCPAFENKRARESLDIPADGFGIYRYLRENGEVMYIGRGLIRQRLAAPDRKDWTFDIVEYSLVENPDDQVKWEAHWLARYKEDHNGELPIYNKIGGQVQ